jgi:hypothetical protein
MKYLTLLLLLIPVMVSAQTEKTENILALGHCKVSCMETFTNDSLVSAFVSLDAKDDRSPTLQNYFTVCYDTPKNVFKFLNDLEKLPGGNAGTPAKLSGHRIEVEKFTGSKDFKVWNEQGLIFHRFTPEQITNIKAKMKEWASARKIPLE